MKTYQALIIALLLASTLTGQNKQDYYWPFGQDQNIEEPGVQAFAIDFNVRPFEPVLRPGELQFDQMNASICDKDGKLLFYTNGCAVANRNHQIMPNGDKLNDGYHFREFWGGDCNRGYPGPQNITILSDPGYEKGFIIIHKTYSYNPTSEPDSRFTIDSIKYTYIDMSLDNGLGDVIIKNDSFYEAEFLSNYLTVIKKINQKDWWIINPVFPNGFAIFSLSNGRPEYHKTEIAPTWDRRYSSDSGFSRFSPDGKHYAFFNEFDGLYLYDFDRQDATFSNERFLDFPMPEEGLFSTCEWSPNSRFLYLAKWDTLWQLDTYAEPLEDGLAFIAERLPSIDDPTGRSFGVAALGPDCRIYLRSKSSSLTFHIIHKPNEKGLACDFINQGLSLPSYSSSGSFPNFPRFRVDEDEKCDPSITSIVGETVWWRRDLTVYPSPATDFITIELPDHLSGEIYILNMEGQIVLHHHGVFADRHMDISHLASGIYSVEFVPERNKERVIYTSRLVVVE